MKDQGFTLVELSIVLVIIGLVAASVIVGRDLIQAAELRGAVTERERYTTAVYAFRTKYGCLPGDCDHVTEYFGEAADCNSQTPEGKLTCNGDGDGQVRWSGISRDGGATFSPNKSEMYTFWQHLSNAGLIEGQYNGTRMYDPDVTFLETAASEPGVNVPKSKLGRACWSFVATSNDPPQNPGWAIFDDGGTPNPGNSKNIFTLGAHDAPGYCPSGNICKNKSYCWGAAFSSATALSLDQKIDDGTANGGKVKAWVPHIDPETFVRNADCITPENAPYDTPDPVQYNTAKKGITCALIFLDGL